MATVISFKNQSIDRKYEPGYEFRVGITDETSNTKDGTISVTHFPPKSESRLHYHTNGDMFFYCISGKTIWRIGKEKKEYVTEPGDFIFIPRGELHSNYNPSETEPVKGLGGYFGCSNPYKSGKVLAE